MSVDINTPPTLHESHVEILWRSYSIAFTPVPSVSKKDEVIIAVIGEG